MKYLGIDFGGTRVGVAISDEEKSFAFPLVVLKNDSKLIDSLKNLAKKEKIEKIIIGDSQNLDFKDNPIMREINRFVSAWEKTSDIPVSKYNEMFTSQEAARVAPKDMMHDARAAALILQGYIKNQTGKVV